MEIHPFVISCNLYANSAQCLCQCLYCVVHQCQKLEEINELDILSCFQNLIMMSVWMAVLLVEAEQEVRGVNPVYKHEYKEFP